jgi:hypothetical protein
MISENEIIKTLNEGYRPDYFKKYKEMWTQTFNKQATGCACNANKLYQDLKQYYKIS